MSDENLDKILEGTFRADILDATGKTLVSGLARLMPGTNSGRFWPDTPDKRLETLLLGPAPVALRQENGPIYRVNTFTVGDTPNFPQFFLYRFYSFGS